MNFYYKKLVMQFYVFIFLAIVCYLMNQPLLNIFNLVSDSHLRNNFNIEIFLRPQILSSLFISLKISLIGAVSAAFLSSLVAYTLAIYEFKLKKLILLLMLILICIPFVSKEVPLMMTIIHLDLLNTHIALWLPFITPILGIFIAKQYIESVVNPDLIEAARMEGASEWYLFIKIIIPIITPVMVLIFLIQFSFIWYLYNFPIIVTQDESLQPISILAGFEAPTALENNVMAVEDMFFSSIPVIFILLCSGYIYKFIKSESMV